MARHEEPNVIWGQIVIRGTVLGWGRFSFSNPHGPNRSYPANVSRRFVSGESALRLVTSRLDRIEHESVGSNKTLELLLDSAPNSYSRV